MSVLQRRRRHHIDGSRKHTYCPLLEQLEDRINPVSLGFALGIGGAVAPDAAHAVATDALGNVYATGNFRGTVDFDPGAGTTNLTSVGGDDVFIAKYTAAGALLWVQGLIGPAASTGYGIAVDGAGNVYTVGSFGGTLDGDPGAGFFNLASAGAIDIFVSKLDSGGNFVWAAAMGGTGVDNGYDIAVDAAGNVFTTGYFNLVGDFDPGAGTFNLTSAGSNDAFISKLDSAGNFVWANGIGAASLDQGAGIAVDGAGNVYVAGSFQGVADFDPGAGTFNLTGAGSNDIFISKFDNAGSFVWAGGMGSAGSDSSLDLAVDAAGNVYATGSFNGTADFDPGASTFNLSSAGSNDVFISRLDTAGNFGWARSVGNVSADSGYGIALDVAGNVYTSGHFGGTVDFDPGAATFNLASAGADDAFISKLDSAGNFVWAVSMGGAGSEYCLGIALDPAGNVYGTGSFQSTADFDPGAGTFTVTSAGSDDGFLWKIVQTGATISPAAVNVIEVGTTDSYTVVLDNVPAADVVVTLTPDGQVSASTTTLTFTPAAWNVAQTVTLTAVDDAALEGDHTGIVTHTVTSADPGYNGLALAGITANIVDNDPGTLRTFTTFNINGDYLAAGVGLNGRTSGTINLAGMPAGSTITAAYLYWGVLSAAQVPAIASLTFAGTPLTGTLVGSGYYESTFPFPNAYNYRADVTGSVTGNGAYALSGVATSGTITTEGASLIVVYANPLLAARTVVLLDGNAFVNGGIPTYLSQTVNIGGFTAPSRVIARTTYIVGDAWSSGNENVAFVGSTGTVNFNNSFDATNGAWWDTDTYDVSSVVGAGSTSATTTATFVSNESFNWVAQVLSVGAPGILVTPSAGSTDVAEGGVSDTVALVLQSVPSGNVLVTLAPDSQVGVVPNVLTFTPANWSTAQTATLTAVDDVLDEGLHIGVITPSVTSGDALYSGLPLAAITAGITDNDRVVGVTITQSGGATAVVEGGGTDTYTVVLLGVPTANVVVTASPAASLSVVPTLLTFTPGNWNMPQTVTVAAIDDAFFQGPRTGIITHTASSTDAAYNGLAGANVTATIADNDAPPAVQLTQPAAVQEGGATSYTIVLQSAPAANVVVDLTPDAQINVAPASVLFTTSDWFVPQTISIATVDDSIVETNQIGVITHTISSADPAYNALALPAVTATIVDNDGTLVLGTELDDRILVNFTGGKVQAIVNGKSSWLSGPISQVLVLAQGGSDFVQITAPTVPVIVLGGSGSDAVWVIGSAGYNTFVLDTASVTLNNRTVSIGETESFVLGGRTGNDTFRIQNLPTIATEFKGDRGNDNILATDTDNDWQVTTASGGTLNGSLTINGIENWFGGAGDDVFTFADKKTVAGKVDGGGGSNTLDYSAYLSPITVNLQTAAATGMKSLANMQSLRGGLALDRLIGPNQSNVWTLSDSNTGDVGGVFFESFENLTGGTLDDTFTLSDGTGVSGKVDGGGGIDALDYAGYSTSVAINLQAKSATALGGVLNFEQFLGGSGDDTLIAGNVTNRWTLAAAGSGALNKVSFTDFENLTGGSGADTFTLTAALADWLGVLNGGNGKDALYSFAAGTNLWTNGVPGSGTLNGRAFVGIEVRR